MTRKYISRSNPPPTVREPGAGGQWLLQDAKARFSELVRLANSAGPQRVTVHGRDAVVVIGAEDFRRLTEEERTGQALIDVLRACPHPEVDLTPPREAMPVRPVEL